MSQLTYECNVQFRRGRGNRRKMQPGQEPPKPSRESGRIPRVSRLMALAMRFEQYLHDGVVADQAELAELGQVTRARISQIMNLLNLAPDIQEALLFLPRTARGRDPIILRDLLPIASVMAWHKQRALWRQLVSTHARQRINA
ncbi:MAG TPA: hypothetical protein VFE62_29430 [Gemmataceae bacterium]|nr:hypothetical protein [Gemmataceae bacterium]